MAVDTAAKRASVLSYGLISRLFIPPDASLSGADRQTLAHLYNGITASTVVPQVHLQSAGSRSVRFSAGSRTGTYSVGP